MPKNTRRITVTQIERQASGFSPRSERTGRDGLLGGKLPSVATTVPNSSFAIRQLEPSTKISGNSPSRMGVREVGALLNESAQADAVGHGRPVEGIPAINGGEDVKRTVTYKATIDLPGHPNKTDAEVLTLLGGSSGNTGTLAIGELLAGSEPTNNGTITKAAWSATGTSTNIEPYGTRAKNTALPLGARVVSTKPPAGKEAALGKVFVVTAIAAATNGGKTANSDAEPSWTVTDGDATTDGGVTYRTVPKFAAPVTYAASTAYDKGTVLRPSANSAKEYLVTTANTAAASTPVWVNADTPGATVAFQTGGSAVCIAGCKTYAFLTSFALGDIVKPNSTSTQEYLVTVPGKTNANVLENTEAATPVAVAVGGSVTHGSATFLRIV